jgi:predicted enzyme related to lactoylglutathione lyase
VHRSRLSTILIDVPSADVRAARRFWSGALGVEARPVPGEEQYTTLVDALPGLVTAIQEIHDGAPRFHVDIETDDVAAETARLTALGAVEIGGWLDCRTLRVPGGHLLCVIPVHSPRDEFEAAAQVRATPPG